MSTLPLKQPVVFRAGRHLYVIVGIFAALFVGIGVAAGGKSGDWAMAAGAVGIFGTLLGAVGYLRWEFNTEGFAYRSIMRNRYVAYDQIERGRFLSIVTEGAERGAYFEVVLKDGSTMKLSLRSFAVQAAGLLFSVFERLNIPIDEPQTRATRRMFDQIVKARPK
jgi:hypothetical protein